MSKAKRERKRHASETGVRASEALEVVIPPPAPMVPRAEPRRIASARWERFVPARFWTLSRRARWAVAGAVVLALALPVQILLGYGSRVTSSNAAVRGYVTEIGTSVTGLVASVSVDVGDRV